MEACRYNVLSTLHAFSPSSRALAFLFVCFVCFAGSSSLRAADTKTIVFFGDSLTFGYGLDDPAAEAYPALIQQKLDAAHLPYRAVNAGLSGETSAGGLRRIDWILRQRIDIFVLALGANDGLRGIEPAVTRANLEAILDRVRVRNPAAKLIVAGMMMPPSMGSDYARDFDALFPTVAKSHHAILIPFLLAGVGGHPDLNQADGIHPTAAGHKIVADTVWQYLRPLLISPES